MLKRLSILFALVAIISAMGMAQVSFSTSVPSRVHQGDKFPVTFRLKNAQGSSLQVPEIDGCTRLFGPSVSTSQSTQIINGRASSSMTIDYTYYYRADKAGTVTIGAAAINADGKAMHTEPVTLTVVESRGHSSGNNQAQQHQQSVDIDDIDTQSADRSVKASDVFVRIILSKSSAYEQEAVECEIKLYTKYGINSFVPTKQPAFDNFLVEDLDVSTQMNIEELYNGERYMTALLKKCILFPQTHGKLSINSGNYDVTVIQYENINMGLFNVRQPRERQITISSNMSSLNVLPLPEPRPAGFNGAVGKFSAESRLIGTNFRSGDPASLIFTIKGTGNIKYIKEPAVDFPQQFDVYTPVANVNTSVTGNNVTGTLSVDYTFVPESPGDFIIPAVPFVYFDPTAKKYVTVETPDYNLKVSKGSVNRTAAATDQAEIEARNNDIRYIATKHGSLSHDHTPVVHHWWFWLILAGSAAAYIIAAAITRQHIRSRADVTSLRLAKANKQARRRFKAARAALSANDNGKFHDEMLRALWGYFSDKLSIPVSELNRSNLSEEMSKRGINKDISDNAISLLDECEMAKYAPEANNERLETLYRNGVEIIDKIEHSKINRPHK